VICLTPGQQPPFDVGVYQLHIRVPHSLRIAIGALGVQGLPAGHYIYTGSARRGLRARLARHQRKRKSLRWHIDYLLRSAKIAGIDVFEIGETDECTLARQTLFLPGSQIIVRGFGSSDCGCPAHLVLMREPGR